MGTNPLLTSSLESAAERSGLPIGLTRATSARIDTRRTWQSGGGCSAHSRLIESQKEVP